jgi:hypothetical protein
VYLVVLKAFGIYNCGDIITDQHIIIAILCSSDAVNVAQVAANGAIVDVIGSRGLVSKASLPQFFSGFLALGSGTATFVELTGSGYARQAISFGPLVAGRVTNSASTPFAATGTWAKATQYGLYDASGNLLIWWTNTAPFTLTNGQTSPIAQCVFALKFTDLVSAPQTATALIYPPSTTVGLIGSVSITSGVSIQIANGVLSTPAIGLVGLGVLPTTLPATAGVLWSNGGVLCVS